MAESITVAFTDKNEIFLVNKTNQPVEAGPGELFGFGLGVYEDKPLGSWAGNNLKFLLIAETGSMLHCACPSSGVARSSVAECIPWILDTDCRVMVVLERSPDGTLKKTPKSLSELCHGLAANSGVTELTITDHDCAPQLGEDSIIH